jgi:hypothetical protein
MLLETQDGLRIVTIERTPPLHSGTKVGFQPRRQCSKSPKSL